MEPPGTDLGVVFSVSLRRGPTEPTNTTQRANLWGVHSLMQAVRGKLALILNSFEVARFYGRSYPEV